MQTATRSEALALISKVSEFAQDSTFLADLHSLVDKHAAKLYRAEQRQTYAHRLLTDSSYYLHAARLIALASAKGKLLRYGPQGSIPDEYQTLEDYGLVHCYQGCRDLSGLPERFLELTPAGAELAEKLTAANQLQSKV